MYKCERGSIFDMHSNQTGSKLIRDSTESHYGQLWNNMRSSEVDAVDILGLFFFVCLFWWFFNNSPPKLKIKKKKNPAQKKKKKKTHYCMLFCHHTGSMLLLISLISEHPLK